ncbi:hypothetical protein WAB17_08600 [Parerythrobacter aurantius]|uniref:hypothetical protein n=1 Tax=Parerythrobacter aurantius TaxID=3127706 RepID=UPI00324DB52C
MAAIVFAAAGAGAGSAIGNTALIRDDSLAYALPALQATGYEGVTRRTAAALPDHYAIETPEGRFEVEELGSRGLYASARFDGPALFAEPVEYVAYEEASPTIDADADRQIVVQASAADSDTGNAPVMSVTRGTRTSVAVLSPPSEQSETGEPQAPLFQGG